MLKDSVTIDDVIELLNDAFAKDPEAINELVAIRVFCNEILANHPTIQVAGPALSGVGYSVGLIGILNGIFGVADDGYGAIAGDFDVICPNGHDVTAKATLRDKCLICNKDLELGKLTGFKRIQ